MSYSDEPIDIALSAPVQAAKIRIEEIFKAHPNLDPRIGMSAPDGWSVIVADLLQAIIELEVATSLKVEVMQIKEKFAGLRCYATMKDGSTAGPFKMVSSNPLFMRLQSQPEAGTPSAALRALINIAESRARLTCQCCGEPGVIRGGHWMFTACDVHSRGAAPIKKEVWTAEGEDTPSQGEGA